MSQAMTEFVYVTYIMTTPQKIWEAITTPEFTRQYWSRSLISDWKPGSKWEMVTIDGTNTINVTGQIVESTPPSRLVLSWARPDSLGNAVDYSRVTFEIQSVGDAVRLKVIHDQLICGSDMAASIAIGWPMVLSGLKSFLETGKAPNIMAIKNCTAAPAIKTA